MSKDLNGLVVAITGAGRGIGLATAEAFLREGARVAIGDIDEVLAKETAARIGASGFRVDVADTDSFAMFYDAVERELGPVDVLVNNAGIMPLGPFADEADPITRRIVSINLIGALLGTKLAMQRMLANGSGHIVNVASAVGKVAVPNAVTYCATKHAVVGLTHAAAAELRGTQVHASVVMPTITNTELITGLKQVRGSKNIQPQDVADVIIGLVRKPQLETFVPRRANASFKVLSLLPLPVQQGLLRFAGQDKGLANIDPAARAAYEDRARTGSSQ